MNTLTVADFVEANAEHFELSDRQLTIKPESIDAMRLRISALFIAEQHRLIAGSTQGSLLVPNWHYRVKDTVLAERPQDIVLESLNEQGGLCTVSVIDFINAFAHNALPGDDALDNQLLGLASA
jgi:hypothetical protein